MDARSDESSEGDGKYDVAMSNREGTTGARGWE